ncbi:MAG: RNA polymerase sigma factor [Thermoleophilia bacterium]
MTDSPLPIDEISDTGPQRLGAVSLPPATGVPGPLEQAAEGLPRLDPAVTERERRLVEAARSGDASAIEALYRDHYNTIYRYALYRVGSPQAAEDVSSQVFLGMVRGLPRFRWQGKPVLAWLYGIAQKQVAMYLRDSKRGREHLQLEQAGQLVGDDPDPGAGVDAEARRSQLAGALRMLPESQREVILLRQVLSLSLAETAATLDRSEGAVKQLQLRGLATLRDILGPQSL